MSQRDTRSTLAVRVGDLHLTGHTQVEIAEKLDISQQTVSNYLSQSRAYWRNDLHRDYEEHLAEALASIRRIMKSTELGLSLGNTKSIEAATKLVERTAKLLGLDHADRMSARMVAVEEAKAKVMISAAVALLDHLGLEGEQREAAIAVMRAEIAVEELV